MYKIHSIAALICLLVACQMTAPLDMASPIVPASPPTILTSIPVPDDGDVANRASLVQFVQPLEDSAEAFRLLTGGGGIRRRVLCTSNTNMVIQPLGAIVVTSSLGVWTVLAHTTPSTKSPATISGGLSASTRYWVYAYDNAGVVDFIASTTAPDASLHYMNGDTRYEYISTFYVAASVNLVPYNQNDNEYTYLSTTTDAIALTNGAATVKTNILVPLVPSQAASFDLYCLPTSTTDQTLAIYGTGQTDFAEQVQVNNTGVTFAYTRVVHVPLISTASFDYLWSGAPGGGNGLTCAVQRFVL